MFPSHNFSRRASDPKTEDQEDKTYKYSREVRTNAKRKLDELFIKLHSDAQYWTKENFSLYKVLQETCTAKADNLKETVDDDYYCG